MTATTLLLGWISIGLAGLTTPSYGFGYQRLSMVSLGWTPTSRDSNNNNDGRAKTTTTSLLMVSNMGWDNENYLESLGKGPEAIEKANEEYNRLKEFGMQSSSSSSSNAPPPYGGGGGAAAGDLSKDQIERIKEQNERERGSGGGEMFQKLMERAQQQQKQQPNYNMPPRQTPPPDSTAGPPAPSSSPPAGNNALPAGFENLSVEAQAALFRELLLNKQRGDSAPPPSEAPPTKDNFIPKGVGPDGRRIGRNRDADAIVNSSDVYFAQLKLDSSVRNQARHMGDQEKADQVFSDPRIRDIKLHVNPHMEEQRKKELEMLETAAEEMIVPYNNMMDEASMNKSDKGVSYKDRLRAKKTQQQGFQQQSPDVAVTKQQFSPNNMTPQTPPPPASTIKTTEEKASASLQTTTTTGGAAPIASTPPLPRVVDEASTSSQQQAMATPLVDDSSPPPASGQPSTMNPPPVGEDQRQSIRTLMGLLLKHRGGPGFGSGRLQGQEVERFDHLTDAILEQLRNEAVFPQEEQQPTGVPPPSASRWSSPHMMPPQQQQQAYAPTAQSTAFVATASSKPASERMNAMIAAVEGALQLYKNSPPELQVLLVGTIQMTLVTAVSTCNQILDSGKESSSRTLSSSSPTYTDVEPETTHTYTADLSARSMSPPASDPSVSPSNQQAYQEPIFSDISKPQYDGSDENSIFLESVYQKLQAVASSSGKLGLREGVSAADADALADDLARMRSLLLEELDSGIPSSSSKGVSSANQKYQDMLAKARAEKSGNDDSKFQ